MIKFPIRYCGNAKNRLERRGGKGVTGEGQKE